MSAEGYIYGVDVRKLPKRFDFSEAEQRWRTVWEGLRITHRDKEDQSGKRFVIDSPPPTVSGSLHIGHVFSYTHQDIIARHRRMTGHNVAYPMGWDDNGLPTERRVQGYFGVQVDPSLPYEGEGELMLQRPASQKGEPLAKISRRKFIEMCHKVTAEDEKAFKELFQRLGLSIDWRDEYTTISETSRRIAQRSFIDLFEKRHVYQAFSPTMWDVDFQTAVAQAEVEDREILGAYHDIEFGVEGGGSFVISTTRPELLPSCVGVAAHPDDERYKDLFGKHSITPCFFARVPIFASTLADPQKGTGILMVCTFGDQNDVVWWKEHNLALRQIVGKDGTVKSRSFGISGWESLKPERATANYSNIEGKSVRAARREMERMLTEMDNSATGNGPPLCREPKPITHSVRFYEKGGKPLEYITSRQWFVRLLDKKELLLEMGKRVHWRPSFMRKRYENWTTNLNADWCVSRQRFFGVPIPVWYLLDSDGNILRENPILPTFDMLPVDPAVQPPPGFSEDQRDKPLGFVGEIDVFDTWFTSSLSPQLVAKWGEENDEMDKLFPMDIRPQSHEIIRTWAFYTIVKAALHHDQPPWEKVVISGWILDPDRKKMSKSKGNAVTPAGLLETYGVDAVRYWAGSARLGMDTAYDEKVFSDWR